MKYLPTALVACTTLVCTSWLAWSGQGELRLVVFVCGGLGAAVLASMERDG